jgi:hypothetical protein
MGRVKSRTLYLGSWGAAAVLGVLVLASPMVATAAAPIGGGNLTLNPMHGRPTAPFAASFRIVNVGHQQCPARASFFWDGQKLDDAPFVRDGDDCVASRKFTPPPNDRALGVHSVTATTGGGRFDSKSYLVEPPIKPTGTPGPTPTTARPTTVAPTPGRTRSTPTPDPSIIEPLPVPAVPEESSPAAVAAGPASESPGQQTAASITILTAGTFVAGGVLVLLGALAMVLLFIRSRREAAEEEAAPELPY